MNKSELIDSVQNALGKESTSRAAAERAVEAVLEGIKKAVKNGETVQLVGFGTFTVTERKARTGVNPRNPSEKKEYPASKTVKFKPGTAFKGLVG